MNKKLFLFGVFLFFPSLAFSKIVTTVKTDIYNFSPKDFWDIPKASRKNSISRTKSIARTEYSIHADIKTKMKNDKCYIDDIIVNLNSRYILPNLIQNNQLTSKELKIWKRYYKSIVKHEKGHFAIGVKTAKRIEKIFLNRKIKHYGFRSCDDIEISKNKIIELAMDNQDNELYDYVTGHGYIQGVDEGVFSKK